MKEKGFCEICRKNVEYTVRERNAITKLKKIVHSQSPML